MLIHVNGARRPRIGVTAGCIVPDSTCPGCKPDFECVEEHAVRIIWIHRHSLVVPVLRIITGTIWAPTVSERAALRTLHEGPACTTVRGNPGADLAASGPATTAVVITNNRLYLCIDVIRVTRRDSNIDSPQLITCVDINKRRAAASVHWRPSRIGAAADCGAKDKSVSIACYRSETRTAA